MASSSRCIKAIVCKESGIMAICAGRRQHWPRLIWWYIHMMIYKNVYDDICICLIYIDMMISCKTLHQCRRQHWQSAVSVHRIQQCASVDTAASNADKHHCSVHTAGTLCNTVHSVQCTGSNTVHTGASNRIQHWCKQHWAPTLTSKSNKCRVGRYGCGGPTPIYWTWYIFHYICT